MQNARQGVSVCAGVYYTIFVSDECLGLFDKLLQGDFVGEFYVVLLKGILGVCTIDRTAHTRC